MFYMPIQGQIRHTSLSIPPLLLLLLPSLYICRRVSYYKSIQLLMCDVILLWVFVSFVLFIRSGAIQIVCVCLLLWTLSIVISSLIYTHILHTHSVNLKCAPRKHFFSSVSAYMVFARASFKQTHTHTHTCGVCVCVFAVHARALRHSEYISHPTSSSSVPPSPSLPRFVHSGLPLFVPSRLLCCVSNLIPHIYIAASHRRVFSSLCRVYTSVCVCMCVSCVFTMCQSTSSGSFALLSFVWQSRD